jgi:hypothetical protein
MKSRLCRRLNKCHSNCRFVAIDGDTGVNSSRTEVFDRYRHTDGELRCALDAVTADGTTTLPQGPICDYWYLLKNARVRLTVGTRAFSGASKSVMKGLKLTENSCQGQSVITRVHQMVYARRKSGISSCESLNRRIVFEQIKWFMYVWRNLRAIWRCHDFTGVDFLLHFVARTIAS